MGKVRQELADERRGCDGTNGVTAVVLETRCGFGVRQPLWLCPQGGIDVRERERLKGALQQCYGRMARASLSQPLLLSDSVATRMVWLAPGIVGSLRGGFWQSAQHNVGSSLVSKQQCHLRQGPKGVRNQSGASHLGGIYKIDHDTLSLYVTDCQHRHVLPGDALRFAR